MSWAGSPIHPGDQFRRTVGWLKEHIPGKGWGWVAMCFAEPTPSLEYVWFDVYLLWMRFRMWGSMRTFKNPTSMCTIPTRAVPGRSVVMSAATGCTRSRFQLLRYSTASVGKQTRNTFVSHQTYHIDDGDIICGQVLVWDRMVLWSL